MKEYLQQVGQWAAIFVGAFFVFLIVVNAIGSMWEYFCEAVTRNSSLRVRVDKLEERENAKPEGERE